MITKNMMQKQKMAVIWAAFIQLLCITDYYWASFFIARICDCFSNSFSPKLKWIFNQFPQIVQISTYLLVNATLSYNMTQSSLAKWFCQFFEVGRTWSPFIPDIDWLISEPTAFLSLIVILPFHKKRWKRTKEQRRKNLSISEVSYCLTFSHDPWWTF